MTVVATITRTETIGVERTRIAALFAGDPLRRPTVGIELELFPFIRTTGATVPAIAPIEITAAALAGLPHVTFEPGGQVEFSPPPEADASAAVAVVEALRTEATRRLATVGIDLVATSVDPWLAIRRPALQRTDARYRAMDEHYAAIGPAGRVFMRSTASTQVCVGLCPGEAGRRQWWVANLVAPLLATAFGDDGRRTTAIRSSDPGRHVIDWVDRDPVEAYEDFADAAGRFQPDHVSTLFPPVRPRGSYLEIRSVDSLGPGRLAAAVSLAATLVGHPPAAEAVLASLPMTRADDARRWLSAEAPRRADARTRDEIRCLTSIAMAACRADLVAS